MPPVYDATNDIYGPEGPPTASSLIARAAMRDGDGPGSRLRVAGGTPQTASHGSRTITINQTEAEEEDADDVHGVLELTGEANTRRVQWDDNVVDNEHMGKKKSKICCIFKRQKEFGESSDESSSDSDSSSGSESDGGPVSSNSGKGKKASKENDGPCDHSDPNHHHHHHRRGPKKPKKQVLNEYEKMPKGNV
ncbi:phosphatase inhibitor-domain-containing protein [Mortierella sp. GBAus27b]|nr:Type 1 phosphatases regulator ypi1 [Mortierella sp. GBA43]KAI8350461.1 phosphatase inhibitor-domain-containing protein [Mortierella sp. GBAus27b]